MTAMLDHTRVVDLPGMRPGRWRIDVARSQLRVAARVGRLVTVRGRFPRLSGLLDIAADPLTSQVCVEVGTGSLTSGNGHWDRVLAGLVDSETNPLIHFAGTRLRPGAGPTRWWLDGRLATATGALELTLDLAGPTELARGRVWFHARGSLPSDQATLLLGRPGAQRLIGPDLRLDLVVEALAAPDTSGITASSGP